MRMMLAGEVIEVGEGRKGSIVKVLYAVDGGKDVMEVFYSKTDFNGNPAVIPKFEIGGAYKGLVRIDDECEPVE